MKQRLLYTGEQIEVALGAGFPEATLVRDAAAGQAVYLVGGVVRDLLLGRSPKDVDLVIEGPIDVVAERLGGELTVHERFSTATARIGDFVIDIAGSRRETYEEPGALPDVEPAPIDLDLTRRDFTINAMAIPLTGEPMLVDPLGGAADLEAGLIRVLHSRSFVDDPTRALRAARYAARFGFELDPQTLELVRATDLNTISGDRMDAEMRLITEEANAVEALRLLEGWGISPVGEATIEIAAKVDTLLAEAPWEQVADRDRTLFALVSERRPVAIRMAAAAPETPWDAVEAARGAVPEDLAIARALGGTWLDDYVTDWRSVALEINGADLLAAGIPEGPDVGAGLKRALRAKLNDGISGRDAELAVALAPESGPN